VNGIVPRACKLHLLTSCSHLALPSQQAVLASSRYAAAFSAALQSAGPRAAAGISAGRLAAAFSAVDLSPVLGLKNAHQVFRWAGVKGARREGDLGSACSACHGESEEHPHASLPWTASGCMCCPHILLLRQLVLAHHRSALAPHFGSHFRLPCRLSYGFQAWLVAPEKGVRALIAEALELYRCGPGGGLLVGSGLGLGEGDAPPMQALPCPLQ